MDRSRLAWDTPTETLTVRLPPPPATARRAAQSPATVVSYWDAEDGPMSVEIEPLNRDEAIQAAFDAALYLFGPELSILPGWPVTLSGLASAPPATEASR